DRHGFGDQGTQPVHHFAPGLLAALVEGRLKGRIVVFPARHGAPRHPNLIGGLLEVPAADDQVDGGLLLLTQQEDGCPVPLRALAQCRHKIPPQSQQKPQTPPPPPRHALYRVAVATKGSYTAGTSAAWRSCTSR